MEEPMFRESIKMLKNLRYLAGDSVAIPAVDRDLVHLFWRHHFGRTARPVNWMATTKTHFRHTLAQISAVLALLVYIFVGFIDNTKGKNEEKKEIISKNV